MAEFQAGEINMHELSKPGRETKIIHQARNLTFGLWHDAILGRGHELGHGGRRGNNHRAMLALRRHADEHLLRHCHFHRALVLMLGIDHCGFTRRKHLNAIVFGTRS